MRLKLHRLLSATILLLICAPTSSPIGQGTSGPCGPPVVNPVACENTRPGNPASEWDVSGAGDPTIQGFATDISVDQGETVRFKINSTASDYRLDIYRLGFYGGRGARKVATVQPSVTLPQAQPACLNDAATGLVDCGNWAESASWTVPAAAVSGIYIAKLVREGGTVGSSHIVFVVRDDDGRSDLLFQTSDTTWHAYNSYGGNSLYVGSPAGRAYKVSYNRPFNTRANSAEDWVFNAEYPMVRWLEAQGYDVSYSTDVDTDRRGAELLEHKVFLPVGHDEYWSGQQRAHVETARAAGVHLAFFSGNAVFWKTRWENSIDGSGSAFRTLVCYKETHADAAIDPADPPTWTGTWRDPRFSPPADGGRPENALMGTIFTVNGYESRAIVVPEADGNMRFWRNTTIASLAPGTSATLPVGTLGYEWDEDLDNGARPPGLIGLSTSTYSVPSRLLDHGSTYGPGTATHRLTLYRHSSGALVFGSGTVQWSWGLDPNHDFSGGAADVRMEQATVNLFADMGVQPATLSAGLTAATASTDTTAPTSIVTFPANGSSVQAGTPITITGTASDAGGVVGGIEVSVDGGQTWRRATGRQSWTFSWTPAGSGSVTIQSRAADDSGNLEIPSAGVTLTVSGVACPCSIWSQSTTPSKVDKDTSAVEVGVRFRSDVDGFITGLRFYKYSTNTGTHVGNLWTNAGTRLATATFTSETASGWQQVTLPTPVAITANTTYVASYHTTVGRYGVSSRYFASTDAVNGPLRALADGVDGANGVFGYSSTSVFPNETFQSENYWVDVVFTSDIGPDTTPPTVVAISPSSGATGTSAMANITATFSEAVNPATITPSTIELRDPAGFAIAASVTYDAGSRTATLDPSASLAFSTTYTATVRGGATDPRVKDSAGNALAASVTWSFTTGVEPPPPGTCPCSIWSSTTTPAGADPDTSAVEVGVKFRSDVDGQITALRFYKFSVNTGTHVGHLWSITGTLLATATFTAETASGWQQVTLATPVPIVAGTTYIASYHAPAGRYAGNSQYFASVGVDNAPLHAPASGVVGGNGVYGYGPSGTFPSNTFNAENYWVDLVFQSAPTTDTTPPTVTAFSPATGATGVAVGANVTATFSEPMDAATITGTTVELRDQGGALMAATVSYDSGTRTATLNPTADLAFSTTYSATVRGGTTDPRVKDLAGNALGANVTWSFTTALAPDTTPPTVTAVTPASGATGVAPATNVTAAFSEAMTASTINSTTFELRDPGGALIAGAVTYASATRTATLNPTADLAFATTYTATVRGGATDPRVKDLAGNALASSVTWSFTTALDTTPPTVTSVTPASGATGVSASAAVTATFNEPMDPATIGATTFELRHSSGALVAASVTYASATRMATLQPSAALANSTTYTATVRGGATDPRVKDLAGNALATSVTWSFTTALDSTPPTVTSAAPASGATAVSPDANVTATFSEAMTASTINSTTFELRDPGGVLISGGVTYDSATRMATLNPTADLAFATTYTATVRGGATDPRVKDLAGNALASSVTWSFTTALDTTPPTVTAVTPASGATGVGPAANVTATFSEAMTASTINSTTFELRDPGGALIAGAVTYASASRTATLNPTADLAFATTYTATVRGGATDPRVKDLAGNALATSVTWSFTTALDTTPPTVTSVTPASGATGVSTSAVVTATFNEPMDPATIGATTFELRHSSGALVAASVTYASATRMATLQPAAALANSTAYTATVKGGAADPRVKDSAGNALAASFTWSFTTVAALGCPCSIWSSATTPAGADPDTSAVEVGVKFRAEVDGFITGLRFYKFATNTGTHVGRLWSRTGTVLATATFTGETASGWQAVTLASPVAIIANTTYVASYHAPAGRYAVNTQYFASGVDNAPLHALASGVDGGNGVYAYGPSGTFPVNAFNSENYWVDVVFTTSVGPDTTPPTVTAVSPGAGAELVTIGANVTATFNEAIDAASIDTTTFQLRDAGGTLIGAAVTYDSGTRTATLDPTANLAYSTAYTATIRGGSADPRVKDPAGNALASSVTWSFTTAGPPGACPCSIWDPSTAAAGADPDTNAVEVGIKFRADADGHITGVRFYKFLTNTGTHVGRLWSRTGTLLATATFTGESASGWQHVNFASPVAITANTTYVASYHAPAGRYAVNTQYFAGSGVNAAPLHALANGIDGGNGVFAYGPSGTFPSDSFNAENYWVDVVYVASLEPDTTPPTIVAVLPAQGAMGVPAGANATVTFSEAMNGATIDASTIELRNPAGALVAAAVTYDGLAKTAIVDPAANLANSTTYTVTVKGGATDPRVKDLAGNALAANRSWSFTTAAAPPPPPGDGPGGPILVISSAANPFSRYYAEILRAEGLNAFAVADLPTITAATLAAYDVVVLGEMTLTNAQVTLLTDWVTAGGNLIAMRPDKKLAGLLGLTDAASTLANGYVLVDTTAAPGAGIVGETIQFHGTADRYSLAGATLVATLYSGPVTPTATPVVTLNSVGVNGGQAAAFAYDLARSIVYTRQGNPAWSGQERDGITPIRSDDLFFGAAADDPRPDWVNLDKVAIPQADEQQRLLANLILHMNADRKPLPRLWYFPRGHKAVVIMTGDDHGNGGTAGRFETYHALSPAGCSVADWECIRGTSYIYSNTPLSNGLAAAYDAAGFEVALHVNTNCANWTSAAALQTFYTSQLSTFASMYPSLPAPRTNRTHCIVWSDYATQPQAEVARGIRLDTNYYYYPDQWIADRPGMFTGSGIPMRFADAAGTLIDVYQAATQMTDESGQSYPFHANVLLDNALGPAGYYGAFTANMHTDAVTSAGSDAIVAAAQARGVPVITARQLLEWLDGRNGSSFRDLTWSENVLSFSVAVGGGGHGMQAMLPIAVGGRTLTTLTLNDSPALFTRQIVKGIEYAIFQVGAGTYRGTYGP